MTDEASEATDRHAMAQGLKSFKNQSKVDGFVLPSSWPGGQSRRGVKEVIIATRPKNKWLSGGAPPPAKVDKPSAKNARTTQAPSGGREAVSLPLSKKPVTTATSGGGAPTPQNTAAKTFYKDMQPGAYIHDLALKKKLEEAKDLNQETEDQAGGGEETYRQLKKPSAIGRVLSAWKS